MWSTLAGAEFAEIDESINSTARNASESPLLRLPTELRCRIYDHLFASTTIHIRSVSPYDFHTNVKEYRLFLCDNPNDHAEVPRRCVEHIDFDVTIQGFGCTLNDSSKTPVTARSIGLELLQASRQIYHEAVLKPFSETRFYYKSRPDGAPCALRKFVDALAPPQAKAITRLRLVMLHSYLWKSGNIVSSLLFGAIPCKATVMKLKGLKDLEIVLAPDILKETKAETYFSDIARDLESLPMMQSLKELRLRTLRIAMEAESADADDGRVKYPTFSSKGEIGKIEMWLRELELRLHVGTMVAIGREPWPPVAIRQDDETIQIPPWSTDEGLARGRAEKERQYDIHRRENQAIVAAQEALVRDGHGPVWTRQELDDLAESARQETRAMSTSIQEI